MKFGFIYPGSDPRQALECAQMAEAAGWDAFFTWETVWGTDPWVLLGALAARTERMRLGTMLTPPSRRRPWKLAAETATLDALSNGRAILAVGLGALETGFGNVGEVEDRRTRAELLDESLDIITGLWRGQPFEYHGKHYHVTPLTFPGPPAPVQQPRIPIWVVGLWGSERSMGRVLRYDGYLPNVKGDLTPAVARAMRAYLDERRPGQPPIDLIVEGVTPADPALAAEQVRPLAEAGATWWNEAMWGDYTPDQVSERARQGPPRL
jgi:alkanesulfonate monooxygenase SsuD/methylene tetrahydromethanopterin reductase-like flavin-dependent oxidoreductase (luciferase family)